MAAAVLDAHTGFIAELLRGIAILQRALVAPPGRSHDAIAEAFRRNIDEIANLTERLRQSTKDGNVLLVEARELSPADLDVPGTRERLVELARRLAEVEESMSTVRFPTDGPLARVALHVIEPFNAVADEHRALLHEASILIRAVIAEADAEDAEDIALARARLADGEAPIEWSDGRSTKAQ